MSEREGLSSEVSNGPAQTGESSMTPEATSTKSGDKTVEAYIKEAELLLEDINTGKRHLKDGEKWLAAMKSHLPENKSNAESNDERKRWAKARKDFVDKYRQKREDYKIFMEDVKEKCENILKSENILKLEAIPHQETSTRAKDIDSVEDKIKRETPALKKKGNRTDAMAQLYERIVDLAGVRILVYFPNDVSEVVKRIKLCGELDIKDSVVSFSKARVDNRAEDKLKQLKGADLNYTDGPWMEKSVSTDEIILHWKNLGYRAAHLHVKLKQKGAITDQDKVPRGIEDKEVGTSGNDKSEQISNFDFPEEKIAEIQITTVVMHAWSQVEHDVIYKNPLRIPINDTIARMLDAVNGLSINSEILLEELRMTLSQARKEAERRDNEKFDRETFREFLHKEYLMNDDREADSQWVSVLSMIAFNPQTVPERDVSEITPGYEIATPAKLRNFVEEHRVLNQNREIGEKQDFAIALLIKLGVQFREKYLNHSHILPKLTILYRFLVVANAFSITVAIDEQTAIDEFKVRYSDGTNHLRLSNAIDHLRLINAIVLRPEFSRECEPEWTYDSLLKFADDFIEADSYETQNIAIALASLQIYVEIDQKGFRRRENPLRFSYSDFKQYREFQAVFFSPIDLYPEMSSYIPIKKETQRTKNSSRQLVTLDASYPGFRWACSGFRVLRSGGTDSDEILYERLRCFTDKELSNVLWESSTHFSDGKKPRRII